MTSTHKQPFSMMTGNMRVAKLFGLWHDTKFCKARFKTVLLIASLFFWYLVPSLVFIAKQEQPISIVIKSILEINAMTIFIIRLIIHEVHSAKVKQCSLELQAELSKFVDSAHEDIRRTFKHLLTSSELLVRIYFTIVLIQGSSYGIVPAALTTVKFVLSNETIELPAALLEADFIFFDHRDNFWVWLPVILISIAVQYFMLGTFSAQECLYWNLLHHVSCLFRIVRMEISRLDWHQDPKQFKKQLAAIVDTHEVCYRSSRCLETVLHPVMAVLYCTCILQTCTMMLIISIVGDFITIASMAFVLQYIMFLIFSFSMLGTELMDESSLVSNAIYNTRWYERPATEQRLLLFMQLRSDQTVGITAGKFFFVTRSTFAGAMKTAFSFFTIMQRFYGNE